MKKYNEGYALPFVLVVMTVLCLIAVSIMSLSLNNLQSQQASIQRMQDQYAAEGEIEIQVVELGKEIETLSAQGYLCATVEDAQNRVEEIEKLKDITWLEDDPCSGKVKLTATKNEVEINCVILISNLITSGSDSKYYIIPASITYESYEIGTGGG